MGTFWRNEKKRRYIKQKREEKKETCPNVYDEYGPSNRHNFDTEKWVVNRQYEGSLRTGRNTDNNKIRT